MRERLLLLTALGLLPLVLSCGGDSLGSYPLTETARDGEGKAYGDGSGGSGGGSGNSIGCQGTCGTGFHCEYDICVPDAATPPVSSEGRSPLTSNRYVFFLERDTRRLVRIDSLDLAVAAFAAGLAPMDLALVGSRELSILLDAFDLVEVLDHRSDPPVAAAWTTARSLSHIALSPTGEHAVLYFDWDDPRAQQRQPEPGNINQVSILYLGDRADAAPFADLDPRIVDVAVGFLPRDVRFSADGSRAIIIGRDTLTPIDLGSPFDLVPLIATPRPPIDFDGSANEILIDSAAATAVMRYADSPRVDLVDLSDAGGGNAGCFAALEPVSDMAFANDGRLIIQAGGANSANEYALAVVGLTDATAAPCFTLPVDFVISDTDHVEVVPASNLAVTYSRDLTVELIWRIDLNLRTARVIELEKAVSALAFAGDGRFLLVSHLKASGTPAWDPLVEDPEVSVDKSYGVSWVDLNTDGHRLAVSNDPFGSFTFVPPTSDHLGATYQAVLDSRRPQLLRVTHDLGFDDRWLDLAATPLELGFLSATERSYVLQDHPWGRVTFLDPTGDELRHVTGFALGVR